MKLPVKTSSNEYASADTMIIDEAGIDLQIDGETELGASFESLDSFQLAYAVLPTDFELMDTAGELVEMLADVPSDTAGEAEEALENVIWAASQELAKRRGYLRK